MTNRILFLGLNYDQLPYLQVLLDRGYIVIGCDQNIEAPGAPLVHHFIQSSYDDYKFIENDLNNNNINEIDYVFSAAAQFSHKTCSYIANKFNIPYPSMNLIDIILDKSKFYPWFEKHKLPIPPTSYVTNQQQLEAAFTKGKRSDEYFLKSDYSKNPKYVYSGTVSEILSKNLQWTKDNFFRNVYILQKKLDGDSLRINIGPNFDYVFEFETGILRSEKSRYLTDAISQLKEFLKDNGLSHWIIKFDIIFNGKEFWVLDIGIDPPMRLKNYYVSEGYNFYEQYIDLYIDSQND